jgi:putative flippase GtrA
MAFPRFLIAGALNTGLTYIMYLGLLYLIPYVWAYTLTYTAGIVLGYSLNTQWVFKKEPNFRSATAYPLTYGLNYFLGLGLLWLFVELMNLPKEIAPLVVVTISTPIMYFFTKAVFQRKPSHETKNNNK